MNRRAFLARAASACAAASAAAYARQAFSQPAGPEASIPAGIPDESQRAALRAYLADVCGWIMNLDVGSNRLKNTKDTANSVFINGNFARVLAAAHLILGEKTYLDEALRWGDAICAVQQRTKTSKGEEAGFWPDMAPTGNIYFGDAGTAAHALAMLSRFAAPERQATYLAALERKARFVIDGCERDPQDAGREATPTWVIREGVDAGAIGCGYYQGKLSCEPYTIATSTTGTAFFSELYAITKKPEYRAVATGAAKWLVRSHAADGEIPYTLAGKRLTQWPLDTIAYCAEGYIAADRFLEDDEVRATLHTGAEPTVKWLVARQNAAGAWGKLRSADQQRSPRAVGLLVWYHRRVKPLPEVAESVRRYCAFLLDANNSQAYGVKELVRTSGFVGLTVADILQAECTF